MKPETKLKKFYERIKINGDCHEWVGSLDPDGYGNCLMLGQRRAHRVSFVLHKGPIPKGALICHTCDNPKCVNPSHLFLGNHLTNNQDRDRKGRNGSYKLRDRLLKHCFRGHEFTEENTKTVMIGDRPRRYCISCGKIRSAEHYQNNKERLNKRRMERYYKKQKGESYYVTC